MGCNVDTMAMAVTAAVFGSFSLAAPALANPPAFEWVGQFGSSGFANDLAFAATTDAAGNFYMAGQTAGTLPDNASEGNLDAFVRKFDPGGAVIWTVQFGTAVGDVAFSIAVDGTGVYVGGGTAGSLDGVSTNKGFNDVFVRKYTNPGPGGTPTALWTDQIGGAGNDFARGLAIQGDAIYAVGLTNSGLPLPGQPPLGGIGDAYLRKLNKATGATCDYTQTPIDESQGWTREFGTVLADNAFGVVADGTGVYVVGATNGALVSPAPPGTGNGDSYIRKYSFTGNEVWTRQFGTTGFDVAQGVAIDSTGLYIAGMTNGNFNNTSDAYVAKYDFDGAAKWSTAIASGVADQAFAVAADGAGSVYVAGRTLGALFGANAGNQDLFAGKLDAGSGGLVPGWGRQSGTLAIDIANGIAANATAVIVVGQTDGPLPGTVPVGDLGATDAFVHNYPAVGVTPSWGVQIGTIGPGADFARAVAADGAFVYVAGEVGASLLEQTSAGVTDAFLRKYDALGNPIWTRQFGTGQADGAFAVTVDNSGVYVAGLTVGALAGPNAGAQDAFVRRYDSAGNVIWTRQFGTGQIDTVSAIAADGAGGIYVGGRTDGLLVGPNAFGGGDAFVRKYDRDGDAIWTQQFGTARFDSVLALSAPQTALYVAGITDGNAAEITADAFVHKLDLAGNGVWQRRFGTDGADAANAVVATAAVVYVAGGVAGNFALPGQTGKGGGTDAFVRKYDAGGNEQWTSQYGWNVLDNAFGITLDATGVSVAGFTSSTEVPGQPNAGQQDVLVRKLTFDGDELWLRLFGSTQTDQGLAISASGSDLYVAGVAGESLPGASTQGLNDAFIARFDTTAPVLTLLGANPMQLECPATYVEPGWTAIDSVAGNLHDAVEVSGTVDTSTVGSYPVTYAVSDPSGNAASQVRAVNVVDLTAPAIAAASVSPNVLSPPNHRMVTVSVSVEVADTCDAAPTCAIVSVSSNEPTDGAGDGHTSSDWQVTGALTAVLRAERSGSGTGRTYTLTVECEDGSGNGSTRAVTVAVPY